MSSQWIGPGDTGAATVFLWKIVATVVLRTVVVGAESMVWV